MTDPYASCPCGSGKKFKWCCQAIYPGIQLALEQDESGQHEAALVTMRKVTEDHAGNPEAWGQMARLLAANEKNEEADAALDRAFAINPNYPFGLMLRAMMRYRESELKGATLLARRAIEAYDPEAKDSLAQLYNVVFDCEMRRNAPVAGRYACEQMMTLQPTNEELRSGMESVFGPEARLPLAARRKYELRKAAPARREAWNKALSTGVPKLSEVATKFESLARQDADDAAAWYNRGLVLAWLGENAKAVEALDRSVEAEADEKLAAEAATLAEVLRCGAGLEDQCDYAEHVALVQVRDFDAVNRMLTEWMQSHRLVPVQTGQEGMFAALVLETSQAGLVTVGRPAAESGRLAAYLMVAGNGLRLSGPSKEPFDRLREEVRQKLALGLTELQAKAMPAQFHDVATEAAVFPVGPAAAGDKAATADKLVRQVATFYEETWVNRPRRSLNGISPADAAGSARMRKKLLGVIAFVEQCARGNLAGDYKFDELRRRLGLLGPAPAAAAPSPGGEASDEQIEQQYQAAHRQGDREAAAGFARSLVGRPPGGKPDRYPYYLFLIQKALGEGATDVAFDLVNAGESGDCEHNGGARRTEYELLRGRVHARRGEKDQAKDTYERLIARVPKHFEARGQAAKAMLDLREPAAAMKFAEEGVAAARQANDRDAEQMLLELTHAAKRAMG